MARDRRNFVSVIVAQQTPFICARVTRRSLPDASKYSVSHFIDCKLTARTLGASPIASRNTADHTGKYNGMNKLKSTTRLRIRNFGVTLFGAALGLTITASAMAADTVTLRVGDQKGGNRSLLEIAGLAKDFPYKIEWSEFPAAAPFSKR